MPEDAVPFVFLTPYAAGDLERPRVQALSQLGVSLSQQHMSASAGRRLRVTTAGGFLIGRGRDPVRR